MVPALKFSTAYIYQREELIGIAYIFNFSQERKVDEASIP